jgi:CheY-like chemotaxis protein
VKVERFQVLAADDHEQSRWVVSQILSGACHLAETDSGSNKQFDSLISSGLNVIVSVITLPSIASLQAIEELKRQGHSIPFVLVCLGIPGVKESSKLSTIAIVEKIDLDDERETGVFFAALGRTFVSRSAGVKGVDALHPPDSPATPEFEEQFCEGASAWQHKHSN